jgi:hypothetical protein
MPCYQVRTLEVAFQMKHRALVESAAKSIDASMQSQGSLISLFGGRIVLDLDKQSAEVEDGYQDCLNQVKQAYSRKAIEVVAKKNRWAKVTDKQNQNQGIFRRF